MTSNKKELIKGLVIGAVLASAITFMYANQKLDELNTYIGTIDGLCDDALYPDTTNDTGSETPTASKTDNAADERSSFSELTEESSESLDKPASKQFGF